MTDTIARRLLATTDAQVWAEEFLKVVDGDDDSLPTIESDDVQMMVGWFANAIETGRSQYQLTTEQQLSRLRDIAWRLAGSDPASGDPADPHCTLCTRTLGHLGDLQRHSPICPYRLAYEWKVDTTLGETL